MWIIKEIKPIQKALVEDNEYIIFLEIILEDELRGKTVTKRKVEQRVCKASKNGGIVIRFNGEKIKSNINDIKSW